MSAIGAYFAKKRWNPSNLKNVEEVWKHEQAEKEEQKKIEQLRREYDEERNREALEELQVKAGVRKTSAKMGWMYEAGASAQVDSTNSRELDAKEREAFLLGDKSIEDIVRDPKTDISKSSVSVGRLNPSPLAQGDGPLLSQAEIYIRNHEDPLTMIIKSQRAASARASSSKEKEERSKKSSKDKKKKKKHHKHRSRSSSHSSDESSSRSSERDSQSHRARRDRRRHRDRSRERYRARAENEAKDKKEVQMTHHNDRRESDRKHDRSEREGRSYRDEYRSEHSRRRSRSRERKRRSDA